MINGIKATSRGISGQTSDKIVTKTSNNGRVCWFSQNETTILVLQNVQFEFRQVQ